MRGRSLLIPAGIGLGGVGGFGLEVALPTVMPNPDSLIMSVVWYASWGLIALSCVALLAKGLAAMASDDKQKSSGDGHSAEIRADKNTVQGNFTVRVGDDLTQGPANFDTVHQVIINNYGSTQEAKIIADPPAPGATGAYINMDPRSMFVLGNSASLTASANVSSVTSAASMGSTEIAMTFRNPFNDTNYHVIPTGGTPNFHITSKGRGVLKLTVDGEMPNKLEIVIQPDEKKNK